jgi:hypothetical protein
VPFRNAVRSETASERRRLSLVSSLLYGMSPLDPITIAGALAVIAFAGVAASTLPALRVD